MKDFLSLAHERFSCRKLTGTVEPEKLEAILEAGRFAPTAVNKQPYNLWVLQGEKAAEKVAETTTCTFGAKTFVVVGAKADEAWVRKYDGKNFAEIDAAIVATHIMLAIHDMGLRSTWVGYFDAPKLKELYPEMKDHELIAIFPIGYAADDDAALPSPRHPLRKSRDEAVTDIR